MTIQARKTVNGAPAAEDEVFSFVLTDANGAVLQRVQNAGGMISFVPLRFTQDDIGRTFTYSVSEAEDNRPYYTTDTRVYTVTIHVDLDADGKLAVRQEVLCNGAKQQEILFSNAYEARGSLQLTARKTVNYAEPEDDQVYSFLLEGEGISMTAVNEGESIIFEEMLFDLSDVGRTYIYTIRETTPSAGNMTSDPSVYTVEVTIIDNRDGTLTASPVVMLAGETVGMITFNNTLEAPLTISKKVAGCETAETFAMTLYFFHADGTEMTAPVFYAGDLHGELVSGESVQLGHGQSITFTGLLPGMLYAVEEEANAAFTTTVNGLPMNKVDGICSLGGNRADFVNTLKTTTFSVRKAWEGEDGGDIVLTLYANGEKMEPQPEYTRSGDTYTYTGLPMYDAEGDQVVYAAREKYMDGYLTIYDNIAPYEGETRMIYQGGTIINRAVTSFRVRKVWSGTEEAELLPQITLTLYCNGEKMDWRQPEPDQEGWYSYKNLPRIVDGQKAVYHVMEEPVDGYTATYADAAGQQADCAYNGYTITNHKIPATGDQAPLLLWTGMLAASAALLLFLFRRRRKDD